MENLLGRQLNYTVRTSVYEGPLDLLLDLIERASRVFDRVIVPADAESVVARDTATWIAGAALYTANSVLIVDWLGLLGRSSEIDGTPSGNGTAQQAETAQGASQIRPQAADLDRSRAWTSTPPGEGDVWARVLRSVNARSEPSTTAPALGVIRADADLQLLAEEEGWVRREKSGRDGRSVTVSLTPEGHAVIERDLPGLDEQVLAAGNLFPDRLVGVERITALVDIGELHTVADPEGTLVWLFLAGDHAEERRLAGAVWPDERGEVTALDRDADVSEHRRAAVAEAHVLERDDRAHGLSASEICRTSSSMSAK